MQEIVIACHADGTVEHTLKDSIFKFPGERQVERVSEVQFDAGYQKFTIWWLMGMYAGRYCQGSMLTSFGLAPETFAFPIYRAKEVRETDMWQGCESGKLLFDTYEQAVEVEVAMLNIMRLGGMRFDV